MSTCVLNYDSHNADSDLLCAARSDKYQLWITTIVCVYCSVVLALVIYTSTLQTSHKAVSARHAVCNSINRSLLVMHRNACCRVC
jgi:hypothetical protein